MLCGCVLLLYWRRSKQFPKPLPGLLYPSAGDAQSVSTHAATKNHVKTMFYCKNLQGLFRSDRHRQHCVDSSGGDYKVTDACFYELNLTIPVKVTAAIPQLSTGVKAAVSLQDHNVYDSVKKSRRCQCVCLARCRLAIYTSCVTTRYYHPRRVNQ